VAEFFGHTTPSQACNNIILTKPKSPFFAANNKSVFFFKTTAHTQFIKIITTTITNTMHHILFQFEHQQKHFIQ